MALPWHIEHILSQKDRLARRGFLQIVSDLCPPGFETTMRFWPKQGIYASILYQSVFSPLMVPNAFYISISLEGSFSFDGIVTAAALQTTLIEDFVYVRENSPLNVYILNQSALQQRLELNFFYIDISSEENYKSILELLSTGKGNK